MWIYKMHFLEDGEFFEYDTFSGQGVLSTEKALPYLESLLSFWRWTALSGGRC